MKLRRFKKCVKIVVAVAFFAFTVNVAYVVTASVSIATGFLHLAPIEEHHS